MRHSANGIELNTFQELDNTMEEQALDFNPRDLIDRFAEQELFTNLVSFTSLARMLTICDKGGKGKSSLIKRLQYNCKYEIRPQVPACLIELDRLDDPSPFRLIEKIVEELKIKDKFPKFDQLNEARKAKNYTPFDKSDYVNRSNIEARVDVKGPIEKGALATGLYAEILQTSSLQIARSDFTSEQEQSAQQKCIEAFFEDLRVVCAVQPIVLLLDAWERCNSELRKWTVDELLEKCCFNPDKNLRPAKLAIVLSSRPYDRVKERYGLRDDEFIPLFADEKEHEATVLSIKSLSDWASDHVRAFLDQHGITNVEDDDIEYIRGRLKRGGTLIQILGGFKVMTAE
jgi:hypothetical protein